MIKFILMFFLRDISAIVKFFDGLKTQLEKFIEAENGKASKIDDEVSVLMVKKGDFLQNAELADGLLNKLK